MHISIHQCLRALSFSDDSYSCNKNENIRDNNENIHDNNGHRQRSYGHMWYRASIQQLLG